VIPLLLLIRPPKPGGATADATAVMD
jgi:hypothetical protein